MGLMTTALIGMGVATAASQIMGGYAAKKESQYNANIFEQQANMIDSQKSLQAGMIDQQKQLQAMQDDRAIRQVMGSTMAATAGKGIQFSGSPIAIMIDTRTQLEMDKAIGLYNLEMDKQIGAYNLDIQKYGVQSQASAERQRGTTAMRAGVVGGLTTLLQTGTSLTSFDKSIHARAKSA